MIRPPRPDARRQRGFTLVELLLAIAVMSLLAILSWRGLDGMVRAQEITRQRADEMLVLQAALGRERRFARDVAHELRTPLAETRMAVELAARGVPSAQVLAGALASIDRMQRCIDGLLTLSRYEAGIEQVDQAPFRQRCGLGLGCAEQGARKEDRWQQAHGRSELRPPEGIKHPPP